MSNEVDYSMYGGNSRPQEGRSEIIGESINNLNSHELNKMNRIIDEEYNKDQPTILDKPFGEVINNTVNFFGNSYDIYTSKLMEAELSKPLYSTENEILHKVQLNLLAIIYFIRDEDNIIYLGIIMIIFAVLLCFFNISRGNGNTTNATISETITK